jgi:PKD repeat protein
VTLTASNAGGADPEVKTSYVTVAADPADVTAGGAPVFALRGIQPNPAYGAFGVAFSLRDASPAWIELIDLGGRRVVEREVGSFGAGPHVVRLDGSRLPAGLYFVRLTQSGRSLITRATILR